MLTILEIVRFHWDTCHVDLGGSTWISPLRQKMNMDQPHIIVVDDEPGIVDNLCFALCAEGMTTGVASTAAEALKLVKEAPESSLVLLDIGLPDGSGLEVCKTIRTFSSIPILFLTARDDEIDKVLGLELGADDYITKPFSPKEVVARVKAVLRRTSGQIACGVDFTNKQESIEIHPGKREVSVHGNIIDLSFYEFEILRLLHSHPGWVYSRDVILSRLWENPDMVTTRTVDAHIKSIRKKLSAAGAKGAITTHRSVGYSYKADS